MGLSRSFPGHPRPRSFPGIPRLRPLLWFMYWENFKEFLITFWELIDRNIFWFSWAMQVFLNVWFFQEFLDRDLFYSFWTYNLSCHFLTFYRIPGPRTWSACCAVLEIFHPRFRPFLRIFPGFLGNLGPRFFPGIAFKSPSRTCSSSSYPMCPDFVSRSRNSCNHFLLSEIGISPMQSWRAGGILKRNCLNSCFKISYHRSDFTPLKTHYGTHCPQQWW